MVDPIYLISTNGNERKVGRKWLSNSHIERRLCNRYATTSLSVTFTNTIVTSRHRLIEGLTPFDKIAGTWSQQSISLYFGHVQFLLAGNNEAVLGRGS